MGRLSPFPSRTGPAFPNATSEAVVSFPDSAPPSGKPCLNRGRVRADPAGHQVTSVTPRGWETSLPLRQSIQFFLNPVVDEGTPSSSPWVAWQRIMGTSQSKFDSKTPLGCLLANLKTLELDQDLRRRRLIHYCTVAWPQYQLDNRFQWPPEGTFDYQILMDLGNFCKRQCK